MLSNSKDGDSKNLDDCIAAVHRSISKITYEGIVDFYKKNIPDAVCEALEYVIALFVVVCYFGYCCVNKRPYHDDNHPVLYIATLLSFLLAFINIVRYAICEVQKDSFQAYEFSLMMTTLIIALIFGCCGCASKKCWIASATINVIIVGLMEMSRVVYMASNNENDWNGCSLVQYSIYDYYIYVHG